VTKRILALSLVAFSLIAATAYSVAQPPQPDAVAPASATRILDLITARRVLMSAIGTKTDIFRGYVDESIPLDGERGRELAGDISTMLLAFPHLFPPETNPDTVGEEVQADPATSTLANAAIWDDFDAFYSEAESVSDLALQLQETETDDAFLAGATDLIAACDSCHANWRQEEEPYEIPIPFQ